MYIMMIYIIQAVGCFFKAVVVKKGQLPDRHTPVYFIWLLLLDIPTSINLKLLLWSSDRLVLNSLQPKVN